MNTNEERRWRNVRKNETTRLPRRHVFFDTEARIDRVGTGHEQAWRLGVASFVALRKGGKTSEATKDYADPTTLWEDISEFGNRPGRTIVWAHNVGYDIRISDALNILPTLDWRLVAHNITSRNTWLEWRRNGSTLLFVDSMSVFNTTLAQVGKWHGIGKVQMSLYSDDDAAWGDRCRADVEILRTAVLEYLAWIEKEDMGNWQITGAGQSWATFRHKFLTHKLTAHDDEEALRVERRAMWAGRCEAYWKGEINGQTVHEWDFSNAYATIAKDNAVPVRLLGPMPEDYDWTRIVGSSHSALLAECIVDTELPVVPATRGGRILWPIGQFRTTLWDPEIRAAIDSGARIHIERAWIYRKRPALQAWGEWLLSQLQASDQEVPAWRKAILKHHGRALIGRMAMTYNQWDEFGEAPDSCVKRMRMWDADEDKDYDLMQVGHSVWVDQGRVEWSQSMPMVTGYIQSIARVKLWDVMRALPERVLLYVDTDSILVTQQHLAVVDDIARRNGNQGLYLKRSWDGFAIYGPRQIVTGKQVRVSGVPRGASHVARGRYDGEVWDSLATSIKGGRSDRVVTRDRTWHITGVDHRRSGGAPGWTEPIRIGET